MRPAESVALEMVADPELDGGVWRSRIEDADDYVPLEPQEDRVDAASLAEETRAMLARLIERSRAEGARTERERALSEATQQRRDFRRANIATVKRFLEELPPERTPERIGFESKLDELVNELDELDAIMRSPAR